MEQLRWYLEHFLDYPFDPEIGPAGRVPDALQAWGIQAFNALFDRRDAGEWLADAEILQVRCDDPHILSWPWEALFAPQRSYLAHERRIERRLNKLAAPRLSARSGHGTLRRRRGPTRAAHAAPSEHVSNLDRIIRCSLSNCDQTGTHETCLFGKMDSQQEGTVMAKVTRITPRVCEKLPTRNAAPAKQREVAALAYRLWLARGFQNGSPQEDWLRAQWEVGRQRLRA